MPFKEIDQIEIEEDALVDTIKQYKNLGYKVSLKPFMLNQGQFDEQCKYQVIILK